MFTLTVPNGTISIVVPPNIVGEASVDLSGFVKSEAGKNVIDPDNGHMLFETDEIFAHPVGFGINLGVSISEFYDGSTQGTAVTANHYLLPGVGEMSEGLFPPRDRDLPILEAWGVGNFILNPDTPTTSSQTDENYTIEGGGIFSFALLPEGLTYPSELVISTSNSVTVPLDGTSVITGADGFNDINNPQSDFMVHMVLTKNRVQSFMASAGITQITDGLPFTLTLQSSLGAVLGRVTFINSFPCQGAVISFLDVSGGFSNVYFEGIIEEETSSEGKTYRSAYNGYNASALTALNAFEDTERYSSLTQKNFKLYTAHADEVKTKRISRLISSKKHYMYDIEGDEWYPVVLTGADNSRYIGTQRKVAQISLTFKLSRTPR